MNFIKTAIRNPFIVLISVLLVMLLGYLSLDKLPYQLTPSVNKPIITVTTTWGGATPYEIESDIIKEQEIRLKSLRNLVKYESSSYDNYGQIKLTFKLGTNISTALGDVSSKLDEVPSYPVNVDRPIIKEAMDSPVIWTILHTKDGNKRSIDEYKTFFENEIKEHFEKIEGVADLQIIGGTQKEMHITLDMDALSKYSLSIPKIIEVLKQENIDISAGIKDVSRRSYRVRTVAKFNSAKEIEDIVIYSDRQSKIYVKDIAKVSFGYETNRDVAMLFSKDGIFMGVKPTSDANINNMTNRVEAMVNKLNATTLNDNNLEFIWIYDQRPYILGAVDLVQNNIMIGGALAIFILILFLRAISPTAVVAIAIPISVFGTFIVLNLMGRSLNTISLAGISFAVGMLVDSAIVVLENIDRHKKMGKSIFDAAYDGTSEVWGALIASVLTTVAVFLPIIFLQDESGQLFKDIAIAVVASVTFSLFVSVTVVPLLWKKFVGFSKEKEHKKTVISRFGDRIVDVYMSIVKLSLKNIFTKITTIVILTLLSVGTISSFFPKLDYLPLGNKNLIYNILIPPSGLSYNERYKIGKYLYEKIDPYIDGKDGSPAINVAFYISAGDNKILFGLRTTDVSRARELIPIGRPIINSLPGIFGISIQSGIFDKGLGKGKTVDVDISGDNIEDLVAVGGKLFGMTKQTLKKVQIRPVPSIELLYPEMQIKPNREALRAFGLSSHELGTIVDVMMDGKQIGDYDQDGKKKIDLVVKANQETSATPENILANQIILPNNSLIPLSAVANIEKTIGISSIRHYNGKRTITLQVTPPANMTIQETMEKVQEVIKKLKETQDLKNVTISVSGTADQLTKTIKALSYNFVLAVVIIYLLMAALFTSFTYPLVILFTVPLATAGGFIGLKLTNMFVASQPLDILTMLGFIILIGIVVNNAILIVHQSLNLIRKKKMDYKLAVIEATKTRIRPIYMSSLTSVFGMLPLVLIPGPGSEFYRGLGAVITGGLALSTIFTIFATPALLMLFIRTFERKIDEK